MTTILFKYLKEGEKFRFTTDTESTVRTAVQVGQTEIYAPIDGENTMGHSMAGGEDVFLKSDKKVILLLGKLPTDQFLLKQKAAEILHYRHIVEEESALKAKEKRDIELDHLRLSFEADFAEVLPMITDAGITYSPHYKTEWEYQGTYIEFQFENKTLKMDYSMKGSYRYEYTKPDTTGSKTYGTWGMEDFIVWIVEKLVDAEPPPPVVENYDVE